MDLLLLILEKLVTWAPMRVGVSSLTPRSGGALSYLIMAARASARKPLMRPASLETKWKRRSRRLEASLLVGDQDYESALSVNSMAADGEECVFYRAEFKLFEAVCLVKLKRFAEAAPLCKEVIVLTHESRWFKLIEPKLYFLANFFAWAALRENGELAKSLPYLEEAARTDWSKSGRCQCWKDLVEDSMAAGEIETARRAFRMMSRNCNRNDARYTELAETLSRWSK